MPVTVVCENCGKAYSAPDNLVGRRVRCRGCGNIVTIAAETADEGPNLDALAQVERSFSGADAMGATAASTGMPHPQEALPAGLEEMEISGEGIEAAGRANLRFNFAGARELDLILPYLLVVGGVLWLAVAAGKTNSSGKGWITLTTFVAWLGVFALFIWPITFSALRQAGRKVGFQLPRTARLRTFGMFLPPFCLTAMLWMLGHGLPGSLIVGTVGGLMATAICLWILFRLRPEELPATTGYGAAGYAVGLALALALLFGLNALTRAVVDSYAAATAVPVSPIGAGFAWISPGSSTIVQTPSGPRTRVGTVDRRTPDAEPPPVVDSGPKRPPPVTPALTAAGSAAVYAAIEDGLPTGPVIETGPLIPRPTSPAVVEFSPALTINQPIDRWIFPVTPSDFVGGARREGDSVTLTWWDSRTWTQKGQVSFRALSADERYALSPDGRLMARIATAPGTAVELWASGARLPERITLDSRIGQPTLIGFTSADRILVRWDGGSSAGLELLDAALKRRIRVLNIPPTDQVDGTIAISPGGTFIALATRDPDDRDRRPELRVYASTGESDRAAQRIRIGALDPRFSVAPTGFSFLPDIDRRENAVVAMMFEQQNTALLAAYSLQRGAPFGPELIDTAGKLARPPGGFRGPAVQWIGAGRERFLLVYGHTIVDPARGTIVDTVDLGDIDAANSCDANTCLVIRGRGDASVPVRVKFDVTKLKSGE